MSFLLSLASNDLIQQLAASAARSCFLAVGGYLAAKGYLTADMSNQFVGLGMTAFAALWSFGAKLNVAANK